VQEGTWGVVLDLPVPSKIPHPKLPSARAVKDPETGNDAIILSTEDAGKIPVDQATRDGEIQKGIEVMRAYKGFLMDCVKR
jgi:hypothetical protein